MQNLTESRRAQAMVEYILMLGAVVVILLVFATRGGFFERELNNAIEINLNSMESSANYIFN